MITLFPHFIARLGGAPFNLLSQLQIPELNDIIRKQLELKKELKQTAEQFSDTVYQLISSQEDSKVQNKLLNLKRTLFNLKKVGEGDQNTAAAYLNEASGMLYNTYQEISHDIAQLDQQALRLFEEQMPAVRQKLAEIAGMSSLQKGLLLSSQSLLSNTDEYRKQDLTRIRKKELKTEESLIKYVSRMTAKTSPFSTFTNLSTGTFGEYDQPMALHQDGPHAMVSHISLNNGLYMYIRGLMVRLPEIYRNFQVRLNPTISVQDEVCIFLTNNNNVEAFQRLPYNAVIELFHEFLSEKKDGITYGEMVNELVEGEYIDAEPAELEEYINQLISFGFIEFNTGVSGIDPFWDRRMVEVLEPISDKSPLIAPVIDTLKQAREFAVQYGLADVPERKKLLQEVHRVIRDTCMTLHEAAGLPAEERRSREELEAEAARKVAEEKKAKKETTEGEEAAATSEEKKEEPVAEAVFTHQHNTFFHFKPEQVFYEDTTSNIYPQAAAGTYERLLGVLHDLLTRMSGMEGFQDEKDKMNQYFTGKYAAGDAVPLMQFYEDFFRDVKVPEARLEKDLKDKKEGAAEPATVAISEERRKKNNDKMDEVKALVKTALTDRQLVNLSPELLDPVLPAQSVGEGSFGTFVQPFYDNGELKLMANAYFPGFGKMFSRFLHIFPAEFTEDLREANTPDKAYIYIENVDASVFNANLHPPLMPYEIWMPGGQNTLPTDKQIPVTDLEVKLDAAENTLQLIHRPSGKQCFVFDLGFQGHRGRSQLFQLLSKFSPTKAFQWMSLNTAINSAVNPPEEITEDQTIVYPRIVFNDSIVLQRKKWVIRKKNLPAAVPAESEYDAFKRINSWRIEIGLPDEVFVFLTSFSELDGLEPEQRIKIGRDGYKPQYISFNNPFLVNLLDKMLEKVPVALRVEEMLPAPDGMLKTQDNMTWVSEFVMQWTEAKSAGNKTESNRVNSAVQ
ncbi:MAG: lantibiotic dehydratase [Bacteroidota bacterium]